MAKNKSVKPNLPVMITAQTENELAGYFMHEGTKHDFSAQKLKGKWKISCKEDVSDGVLKQVLKSIG